MRLRYNIEKHYVFQRVYYYKLLFIFSLGLLASCEQTVTIPLPDVPPQLTVNCFLEANKTSTAYITVTENRLDANVFDTAPFPYDSTAIIALTDVQGNQFDLWHQEGATYQGNDILPTAEKIRLRVDHTDYEQIRSTTTIPTAVSITDITFRDSVGVIDGDFIATFEVTFTDPEVVANYYFLQLYTHPTYDTTILDHQSGLGKGSDIALQFYHNAKDFFSDELFNGTTYSVTLAYRSEDIAYLKEETEKVSIVLGTTDDHYFKYHQTLDRQIGNNENPFSEPTPVYTNIENGLGIFAAYATDTVSVRVW